MVIGIPPFQNYNIESTICIILKNDKIFSFKILVSFTLLIFVVHQPWLLMMRNSGKWKCKKIRWLFWPAWIIEVDPCPKNYFGPPEQGRDKSGKKRKNDRGTSWAENFILFFPLQFVRTESCLLEDSRLVTGVVGWLNLSGVGPGQKKGAQWLDQITCPPSNSVNCLTVEVRWGVVSGEEWWKFRK